MHSLSSIREVFTKVLETAPGDREALLTGLPEGLRVEVISLLSAHESAGSFLGSSEDATIRNGERIGPYLLLEKISQGGMGVVYKARRDDGEFQRDVAIKVVDGRLFAPEAERRFIEERRILALLDHPHIVHMIDGGIWQGQRYLVMELIAGQPVTQFCTERVLPLNERLRLFQTICSAIQYAHQHLIIHRDLKPNNILVTAEGTSKVLDFGIARLLDDGHPNDSATTALNPMTLSCASPEQVRGERLTLATDIFSLGLLLNELLTGRNPQSFGTRAEIMRRVVEEESPAPGVSPDLDAIVLKALSKDPAQRYASAGELSADVGRFLENRPVLAHSPSRFYHAMRFCARNRALTAMAIALALALVTGMGVSLWQARRAERQEKIVERRFEEARRMAYTVIHEIQPQLAKINGTVALRKQLIEKSLSYLEALGQDAGGSPPLMRDLIDAYVELAGVAASVSQANVGDQKQALDILQKANSMGDRLLRAEPDSASSLRTMARFYRSASGREVSYGSRAKAIQYARQSVATADRLAAVLRGDDRSQDEIALSSWQLASVLTARDESIRLYGQCLAIWNKALLKSPPNPAELRRRIALVHRNLATAWLDSGDFQRAADNAVKARELDEPMLRQNPGSPEALMAVAFDVGQVGAAYKEMGKYAIAAENWRLSATLREKVVTANPDDHRAADRLGYALHELADLEKLAGDFAGARRDFRRAIDLYTRLMRTGTLVPQSLLKFAQSSYQLGKMEREAGSQVEGCRWLHKTIGILDEYAKKGGDSKTVPEMRSYARSCPVQ